MSATHSQTATSPRSVGGGAGARPEPTEVSSEESLLPRNADPDAVVDGILSLLGEERFPTARRMAAAAVARFPEHARVRRAWGIFDPRGKATVGSGGPEPPTTEEFNWLRDPPEWARGKWVALVGSEAVAAADTLAEVLETVRSLDLPKRPLAVRIDER